MPSYFLTQCDGLIVRDSQDKLSEVLAAAESRKLAPFQRFPGVSRSRSCFEEQLLQLCSSLTFYNLAQTTATS